MGEIADDMIEGRSCSGCGCYFAKEMNIDGADVPVLYEHSYPVLCWDCWKEWTPQEREGYSRADVPTL